MIIDLPFVTMAVHDGVDPPVHQTISGLEPGNPKWTSRIVASTTLVCRREHPNVSVFRRAATLTAPFRTRYSQKISQISPTPIIHISL